MGDRRGERLYRIKPTFCAELNSWQVDLLDYSGIVYG